jgi:hypothetical protein
MIKLYRDLIKPPLDFDLENCTRETVLDQLEKATGEYNDRGSDVATKVFRKLGDVALVISPVLAMIPDDCGIRVLHGGLAIIFSVSSRFSIVYVDGDVEQSLCS